MKKTKKVKPNLKEIQQRILFNEIKKEVLKKAVKDVSDKYTAVIALVLHDKCGFDKEQLLETMEEIYQQWDSVAEGYIKIEDVKEILEQETGIKF